jgi:hypothetical protein
VGELGIAEFEIALFGEAGGELGSLEIGIAGSRVVAGQLEKMATDGVQTV